MSEPEMPDEEMGGDAACWAHLFAEDAAGSDLVTNLVATARESSGRGPIWTRQTEDLNVNLLLFRAGEGVEEHVNSEVDVLLIGVSGAGVVAIDGAPHALPPGHCMIVPKGARRSTRAVGEQFAYLTCHRRRAGLMPTIDPPPPR